MAIIFVYRKAETYKVLPVNLRTICNSTRRFMKNNQIGVTEQQELLRQFHATSEAEFQ